LLFVSAMIDAISGLVARKNEWTGEQGAEADREDGTSKKGENRNNQKPFTGSQEGRTHARVQMTMVARISLDRSLPRGKCATPMDQGTPPSYPGAGHPSTGAHRNPNSPHGSSGLHPTCYRELTCWRR